MKKIKKDFKNCFNYQKMTLFNYKNNNKNKCCLLLEITSEGKRNKEKKKLNI
jgi:hypothetical protein